MFTKAQIISLNVNWNILSEIVNISLDELSYNNENYRKNSVSPIKKVFLKYLEKKELFQYFLEK